MTLKGGVDRVRMVNKLQKDGVDGLKGCRSIENRCRRFISRRRRIKNRCAAGVNAGVDQVKGAVDTNVGNISNGLGGLDQLLSVLLQQRLE